MNFSSKQKYILGFVLSAIFVIGIIAIIFFRKTDIDLTKNRQAETLEDLRQQYGQYFDNLDFDIETLPEQEDFWPSLDEAMFFDLDGDGLISYEEVFFYKTDPLNPDTDGDGFTDHEEIFIYGTDPLDPDDYPKSVEME